MQKQSFYINMAVPGKKIESFPMFSELKFKICSSSVDLEAVGDVELQSLSMICPQH